MDQGRNIIIIGPAPPLRGGIAAFNLRLARAFMTLGHKVILYTFSYQYPGLLFPGKSQYAVGPLPADVDIRIKINSVYPLNWIAVGDEIRKQKPDIVVVRYWLPFMGPCLGTILRRIRKNNYSKIVCIADNIIPHERRPGDRLLTRYFIKPVDSFIVMSNEVLSQLKEFDSNKPATLIPHPLYDHFGQIVPKEKARQFLNLSSGDRILLFFGFIRKYKGLDILLKAIRILSENPENHNLKLLIAGEFYDDKKNYADLLNDPLIGKHLIIHTKFIADSQVKYYLCSADCTVQPYRSATQSGVTPLSYHFEIPMIVTNVGGLPDMVPDHLAGLVAQPDPGDIADKIEEYFALGKDYFLPGLREEKKKYNWRRLVEGIVATEN